MTRRLLQVVAVVVVSISVVMATRTAWVAYGPAAGQRSVAASVGFLDAAIDAGAGARMQALFPEGAFFLTALTGAAAATVESADLERVRALRDRLWAPDMLAPFGDQMTPEHGIFATGWTLSVAVDVAERSGATADRDDVERRALEVDSALRSSRSGFLEGYPGAYWPCDTVVAASSLARAAVLLDRPGWLATVRAWMSTSAAAADPATGLLPHRVDAAGRTLDGPRGSSQSIIQAFWPDLTRAVDGQVDVAGWQRFTDTFVVRRAGLVGVREYPVGVVGTGDVDSGPLLLGVSASASVVTMAAARAVGDQDLADALNREAELLGAPMAWAGQRRYALGQLPVGDAFLAWARSRPEASTLPSDTPSPWWPMFIALPLLPAAGGVAALVALRRRQLRPPPVILAI